MKKICCLLFLFSLFTGSNAQNLIPNGDFEQYRGCPTALDQLDSCLFWMNPSRPSGASPDYFNQCSSTAESGVPINIEGFQQAHSGNAYCGLLTYYSKPNRREYIEVPLNSSLKANTCYHFKMYVNLSNVSRYTTHEIGVYFSDTIIHRVNNFLPLPFTPQINNAPEIIPDTLNWTLIEGDFTASGGENFLIIGNFKDDRGTKITVVNSTIEYSALAYLYIDDVSLIACEEKRNKESILTPEIGKAFILKNISFETDKSELLLNSMAELDTLVRYLLINTRTTINISGYTDNIGSEGHNLQLSFLRAKAVANYLVSKGVDKTRISYNGYGSAKPIQSNESENGRLQNRRVEFIIKNK